MTQAHLEPNIYREYCAMQFYAKDCFLNETIPIRWQVLREDLRNKFLYMADKQVAIWHEDEEDAKKRREQF